MKGIIVYYSYSGNTRKIASTLQDYLRQKGQVESVELRALDEAKSFFAQGARAFKHARARIEPVSFDLKDYELICVGTPVWAFGPAPAVNAWLDAVAGVAGKKILLFSTYGSGTGNERCLNYMQKLLAEKGASNFTRFSVQQFKVSDNEFVLSKIKEMV